MEDENTSVGWRSTQTQQGFPPGIVGVTEKRGIYAYCQLEYTIFGVVLNSEGIIVTSVSFLYDYEILQSTGTKKLDIEKLDNNKLQVLNRECTLEFIDLNSDIGFMKINSPTPLSTVELEVSSNLQVGDTVIFQAVHVSDGPKTASSSIRCLTGDDFCGNYIHMTNVIIRNDRNYGFAWRSLGIFLTPDGKFVGLEVSRCRRDNQLVHCLPAEYITEILNQSGVLRKPQVNLGIIGYESHGKTTLAAAIREVLAEEEKGKAVAFDDPDTAFSKKQRRITNVTDMTAEASQLDGGILVMSATDKLAPQTKDYIILARQLDMKHSVCFLNKLDAVHDPELLDVVEMEESMPKEEDTIAMLYTPVKGTTPFHLSITEREAEKNKKYDLEGLEPNQTVQIFRDSQDCFRSSERTFCLLRVACMFVGRNS